MLKSVIVPQIILKLFGYWKFGEHEHWIFRFHRTVGVLVFVVGFSALEIMHLVTRVLQRAELTEITDDLTHVISHMQVVYKVVLVQSQRGFVQGLYERTLRRDDLTYEASLELDRVRREAVARYTAMNWHGMIAMTAVASIFIVLGFGSPFLLDSTTYYAADNVTMMTTRPLPFKTWVPFPEGRLPHYYWVLAYQGMGMMEAVSLTGTFDAMFYGMLGLMAAQFEILRCAISTIQQRTAVAVNNMMVGTDPKSPEYKSQYEREMENELRKCAVHHQAILRTCDQINDVFNYLLASHFSTTLIGICVCLFQCLVRSGLRVDFVYMIFFSLTITGQLFLYCWYGKELTTASSLLPDALYSSYWLEATPKYRSNFRLFLLRSQAPVVLSALGIFPLSLVTFGSIMKTSYSFFSVLQQMDDEQDVSP